MFSANKRPPIPSEPASSQDFNPNLTSNITNTNNSSTPMASLSLSQAQLQQANTTTTTNNHSPNHSHQPQHNLATTRAESPALQAVLQVTNPSSFVNPNDTTINNSLKEQKKSYHKTKRYFTKNIQSAIESTHEVHSGWLKARTSFKRWTKVWCQIKPSYLIMYTSQEAQKKHQLGVILLPVCQAIMRPTSKDGFCFKLINPFNCSVWAKSSTKALAFPQASLTLRASDTSIGKLWLNSLNRCHLSANLEGYQPVIEDVQVNTTVIQSNRSEFSDSDDGESTRNFDSMLMIHNKKSNNNNNLAFIANNSESGTPFITTNGNNNNNVNNNNEPGIINNLGSYRQAPDRQSQISGMDDSISASSRDLVRVPQIVDKSTSHLGTDNNNDLSYMDSNNRFSTITSQLMSAESNKTSNLKKSLRDDHVAAQDANNTNKMVAKFMKYNWRELKLERLSYVEDGPEELGISGIQSEEVHDSNKNFLWHIIKQLRPGMDLSKITLPTFILEPRSFLEKLADYYYHSDILSEAVAIEDPLMRLVNIVKWYLSGFYKKPRGSKKPYNPLLGEQFRCFWDHPKTQSRTFFVAEQVSHHPPISAFHASNRKDGFTITCALLSRSKFGGNSVSAILDGKAKLHLTKRNETYTLTMPYANCRGILLGSLCLELGGKVEIECAETGCKCELDFKLAPVWAGANSYNSLTGKILKENKLMYTIEGHWDKKITITDKHTNEKSPLWEVSDATKSARLRRHTVAMDDLDARESVKLWSKVTEALQTNDHAAATVEKTRLEDMQRQEARERKGTFLPKHFRLRSDTNEWTYRWLDNRPWNYNRDIMQFEDDFKIRTLMLDSNSKYQDLYQSPNYLPEIDLPLNRLKRFSEASAGGPLATTGGRLGEPSSVSEPAMKQVQNQLNAQDFWTIESKMNAENSRIKQAIEQVSLRNKKLEDDLAKLKRSKKVAALFMAAIVVALMSAFLKYFPQEGYGW